MAAQITTLPPAPSRTDDQATFTTKANNFVAALADFVSDANTLATEAEADAATASTAATTATTQATNASNSAAAAAASAASAGNSAGTQATSTSSITIGTGSKSLTLAQTGKSFVVNQFVILVNTTTNWMAGNITAFNSGTGAMTVDVVHSSGSGSLSSWTITPSSPNTLPNPAGNAGKPLISDGNGYVFGLMAANVPSSSRTSNTMLVSADKGSLIDITANTFTQTFDSAATLGNGWNIWLRNSGTGDITIPSSDGVTNWIMYPGEVRFFQCNGSVFRSFVIQPFYKIFTSTANFVKPPGYQSFGTRLWGGGNSGKKSSANIQANGGGGGGCTGDWTFPSSLFSTTTTVTVAAGGSAQTSTNTDGNPGGTTSLGSLLSITNSSVSYSVGGSLVDTTATVPVGWEAGSTNANASNKRPLLGGGSAVINTNTDPCRNSYMGGGAGGSIDSSNNVWSAGTSVLAGNGGAASLASNGTAGVAPAGGGGATQTGTQSGAGARGEAHVWGEV